MKSTRLLPLLRTFAWVGFLLAAQAIFAADTELKFALLVTRHGVRAPVNSQLNFARYSAEAWPDFGVPPGYLTPHGKKQMTLMGQYYLAYFQHEGLLTGKPEADSKAVYFRSDSDQRTIETAMGIAAALLPGIAIDPHARAHGTLDPLFRPAQIPLGQPNVKLARAAALGRIGGDPQRVLEANRAGFETLERVLVGESGVVPAGKTALSDVPTIVRRGTGDHTVALDGPLHDAASMIDVLTLQYTDGMPMERVGWGRLSSARLTELLKLQSLYYDLAQESSYTARVQGSNFASHILATLEQAATHQADPHAFGAPGQKLVVVTAHDTNISNLGGLLGLSWYLPGTQHNPVLPGGALVFELRERRVDHQLIVCVYYLSQTLEQIRDLAPLSLDRPPAIAPIFIPRCSTADEGFPAPLADFAARVRDAIDPEFVAEDPN